MSKHRVAILLLAVVAASALALGARADVDRARRQGRRARAARPGGFLGRRRHPRRADRSVRRACPRPPATVSRTEATSPTGSSQSWLRTVSRTEATSRFWREPVPDGFSDGGDIPDGMIAVFAEPAGDGFPGGGNVPEGLVAVLMEPFAEPALIPQRLGASRASSPQTMRPGVRWARPGSFQRSASWCRFEKGHKSGTSACAFR